MAPRGSQAALKAEQDLKVRGLACGMGWAMGCNHNLVKMMSDFQKHKGAAMEIFVTMSFVLMVLILLLCRLKCTLVL